MTIQGVKPLTGKLNGWMRELLDNPEECARLVAEYGSPVNVHDLDALVENADELLRPVAERGLHGRVFVARKANKTVAMIDAAREAGLGVDVASLGELEQCIARGVSGADMVVSAAVKPAALLERCIDAGVVISLDNEDEAEALVRLGAGRSVRVAFRLSVVHPEVAATRFGMRSEAWLKWWDKQVQTAPAEVDGWAVEGVHFHLNGYSAGERSIGLHEACALVDDLRGRGLPVRFIDMGGGVPMRYLEDEQQWREFWHALEVTESDELTWRGDRLGMRAGAASADRPSVEVYPFWQPLVRGEWMAQVLDGFDVGTAMSAAQALRERSLELRLEPGRAILDGCGMTLAAVSFRKQTSDGVSLVGLLMNRTQVRSTSRDMLVDPYLVRQRDAVPRHVDPGFLVGAYCIEDELLLRRRMEFLDGVALDDLVAFPNTAGYLMHIVESASHQIPLAANVVHSASPDSRWVRDLGDRPEHLAGDLPSREVECRV